MVIDNMDILVQMKNNFDKPEEMANLKKRLTGEKWGEEGEMEVRGEDVKVEAKGWLELKRKSDRRRSSTKHKVRGGNMKQIEGW